MEITLFKKKTDEYTRYWASVSTEKTNKKGKGTGEYIRASLPVRLSNKAAESLEDSWTETKNDAISYVRITVKDCWFKAAESAESEPFVVLFVNACKVIEED